MILMTGCKKTPTLPYTTDLESAIRKKEAATVKLLLDAGVDPNGLDAYMRSPMCDAAVSDDITIVKILLDHGAKPQRQPNADCSPVASAAQSSSLEVLTALIKAGADVNGDWPDGLSPLANAISLNNQKAGIFLIKNGANPNAAMTTGRSLLSYAVDMKSTGEEHSLAVTMLEHGATLEKSECSRAMLAAYQRQGIGLVGMITELPACKDVSIPASIPQE